MIGQQPLVQSWPGLHFLRFSSWQLDQNSFLLSSSRHSKHAKCVFVNTLNPQANRCKLKWCCPAFILKFWSYFPLAFKRQNTWGQIMYQLWNAYLKHLDFTKLVGFFCVTNCFGCLFTNGHVLEGREGKEPFWWNILRHSDLINETIFFQNLY